MDPQEESLLGELAVKAGYVDASVLQHLMKQLGNDRELRLVDLLRAESLISAEQQSDLESQVRQLLSNGKSRPSIAKSGNHDVTIDGPSEHRTEQPTAETITLDGPRRGDYVSLETVASESRSRDRYTLTREHGRGGLGCVWLARDSVLNREVALKEVLAHRSGDKSKYRRLLREAQITGQLEHPNIVPVYELVDSEGVHGPFYTMRFLRGETLGERIKKYRQRRRERLAGPLELRELLDAFVSICHALSYAHSRRIIHRDLKPSNVLVGEFGEVVVVDWGLAKHLSDPKDPDVNIQQISLGNIEEHSCTRDGQALGTPAFMAPEQANGQMSLTDELTDIYGLGTILFMIMTGKPPHVTTRPSKSKDDTHQLLRRICTLDTPRIRSVEPQAPPTIDAICAKAMSRLRSDRYATADELARDVQRWLADEPVLAYPDKPTEKILRWLRRNRAASLALAAVLLMASVAGFTIAVVTTNAKARVAESLDEEKKARNSAVEALQAEQSAKKLALQQYSLAQDAIDRSLSGVSEIVTVFPGTETLRSQLLQAAAEDYEKLLDVDDGDVQFRREAARTRIRLADLQRQMQDLDKAEANYRRAESDLKTLQSEYDSDPSWRLDLAFVWSKLALLYTISGEHDLATRRFEDAVAAYKEPFADQMMQQEAGLKLAGTRLNQATMLREIGQVNEAVLILDAAKKEFKLLAADDRDDTGQEGLAMCLRELGQAFQLLGKNPEAIEELRNAESTYKRLVASQVDNQAYLEGLAHTRMLLATAMRMLDDDLAAMRIYESSVDDYLNLLKVRPGIPNYRHSVAAGRVNIAQMLYRVARSRDAKVFLDDAIAEFIDLSQTYPQVTLYREAKANCLTTLGMVLRDLNDAELTAAAFNGGIDEFRWLHEDFPDVVSYRGSLGISLMGAARLHEKHGETRAAQSLYEESIRELTTAVDTAPEQISFRDALAWCHFYLGELLASQEKIVAAIPHFKTAVILREELPKLPELQRSLVRVLSECTVEEILDPKRAIEIAQELCDGARQNPDFRYSLAVAYLANKDSLHAEQEANAAVQLRADPNPFDLYVLAIAQHQNKQFDTAVVTLAQARELMSNQCPGRIELVAWEKIAASEFQKDTKAASEPEN